MKEFKNLVSAEQKIFTDSSTADNLKVENDQLKSIILVTMGVVVAIAVLYCIDSYIKDKANREQPDQH